MSNIKFTTDSVCDIPAELRQNSDIQIFPFPIIMGDQEYMDGVDFTPDQFYQRLLDAPAIPTHAQLTSFFFEEQFEEIWQQGYEHLIHVSINSKGSSTFQNAVQARENFYRHNPQAKENFQIHLIDSKNYTMSYGWPLLEGVKMAQNGSSAQEIVDYIQDWVDHVQVVFAPLDLRFAKKSGRVSAAAAFMGEALGLKPIMTFENGESKVLSKVRGEKAVIKTLVELCQSQRKPNTPYLIIRGSNASQLEALQTACSQTLGEAPALTYPLGCIVAINAGPNVVGLVYRT